MRKYVAVDHENSKYYKDVPYITKKEFKKLEEKVIIGKTKLKKYKSDYDDKELDILSFRDNEYEIKNKIYGFKKGYVDVGNNNYIMIKRHIPFLLLFLLFLALILIFTFPKKDIQEDLPQQNQIQEDIKKPSPPKKDEPENKPSISKPQKPSSKPKEPIKKVAEYTVNFDANGGIGNMNPLKCEQEQKCKLPEGKFFKEGYSFIGWAKENNGELIYSDTDDIYNLSTEENGQVTLYAKWNINSFDIVFLDYDDSVIEKVKYNYNDVIKNPKDPIRKGYTFLGWDNSSERVKDNLVIKAQYNLDSYDIVYNLNGGNIEDAISNYDVEKNSLKIPNPNKEGYDFIGWTQKDKEEPIKDYEIPKGTIGNIELTANYEPISYKLIFNTNGANEELEPKEIKYDSSFGELSSVTKDGYNFIDWTDKEDKPVSENTVFKETNDINIYANWETITYNLTYNLIGGEIEETPNSFNVESETIKIPNPTKEGYIFLGWMSKDDVTFKKDYEIPKGTIGDIELTANYKPISYTINYHSAGGKGTMESSKVKYNNRLNLNKNNYSREGYIFKGWSTEENGKVTYLDEQQIYNLSNKDNDVINLYANWEIIKLNVKYYDLFDVLLKEEIVDYGCKPNVPEEPFIEGYTFIGWGSSDAVIKQDSIFKAQYSLNDYVVKYNLNMGNSDDLKENHYNVESNTFSLPQPTRIGYTFLGWTGSNGLKPEKEIIIPKSSVGNKNYKANWIANVYKVSLNPNNGSVIPNSINISYNSLYGILPTAKRRGYTFDGWYYENSLIEESTIMQKSFNHELKADWKIINYDIAYNLNGGNVSSKVTKYNVETDTFDLPIPEKTGYTFLGWTGSNGNTPTKNVKIEKGSIGNREYTANYTVNTYSISYSTNMSSLPSSNPTSYTIESETFALKNPNKYGEFSFVGWSGTGINGRQMNVSIPKGSFGNKTFTANWYDDTAPTITGFTVTVLGLNSRGGHNISISIDAYDNGVGIDRFETWLVPYKNGSGAGREIGASRILENVLYLNDPEGRTLCGYAIDRNGNEAEACYTVHG